jgi:hypothetical protein
MPGERSWAQTIVATLVAAPAVPDMATQLRCPACGRVSAASDLRHVTADRFRVPMRVLLVLGVLALLWAVAALVGS